MLQLQNDRKCRMIEVDPMFRLDVLRGLNVRPRAIPARWLYDRSGSALFETITTLPEYYPTRTESSILTAAIGDIAALIGPDRVIVEFGAGSSTKTPILLSEVKPAVYVPIDISAEFLADSAATLSLAFPHLPILPMTADFTRALTLPESIGRTDRLGFFPGSTIGNLLIPAAVDLLRSMATTLGDSSMLLIGIDRIKDPSILLPAYDDSQGATAAFNLNILHRINRELAGTVPLDAFRHVARWNACEMRIEMHLEATRDVSFEIDGWPFSLRQGETIHTENSLKYGPRDTHVLLQAGGWSPIAEWTDRDAFFSLILAKRSPVSSAP